MSIGTVLRKGAHEVGKFFVKNGPKLIFWGSMAAGAAGTVWASIVSAKVPEKAKEFKKEIEEINQKEEDFEISDKEAKLQRSKVRVKFIARLGKLYAGPVVLLILSGGGFVWVFLKQNKVITALTATCASWMTAYGSLEEAIEKRFGKEVADELALGMHKEVLSLPDETGEVVDTEVDVCDLEGSNPNLLIFDREHSIYATDNLMLNLNWVNIQDQYLTDDLRANGDLTLRAYKRAMGLTRTRSPENEKADDLQFGWEYLHDNPNGDNDVRSRASIRYVPDGCGGYKQAVVLDPNCDGNIFKIEKRLEQSSSDR